MTRIWLWLTPWLNPARREIAFLEQRLRELLSAQILYRAECEKRLQQITAELFASQEEGDTVRAAYNALKQVRPNLYPQKMQRMERELITLRGIVANREDSAELIELRSHLKRITDNGPQVMRLRTENSNLLRDIQSLSGKFEDAMKFIREIGGESSIVALLDRLGIPFRPIVYPHSPPEWSARKKPAKKKK